MTAVAGPEKSTLLFSESLLAAQAIGLLSVGGVFLQSKVGDVQAQMDLCSDSRGITFNPFNLTEQFLQIDVIHNTVRPAVAKYGFCYTTGEEAECELLTSGEEFGKSMLQHLLLEEHQTVLEAREGIDSGRFDQVVHIQAEPGMIISLAQSAFEAADNIDTLPQTQLEGEPRTPEDGYTFFPPQGEVVPVLGRLICTVANAVLHAGDRRVNATVAVDSGPEQIYQMAPLGFERPVNLVTIWSKDTQGATTLFHFEAEPELGVKPGYAVARAYIETISGPSGYKQHYVTRLCQHDGVLFNVTTYQKKIVSNEPVESWHGSVEDMARQAVASTGAARSNFIQD